MILEFPIRHRAASKEAAASSASVSARKPLARATRVLSIDFQRSEGMLSRCHHFLTAGTEAPTSSAIASFEGQNPITSRKELGRADMADGLGQSVLKSKAKMSRAVEPVLVDYVSLMDRMTETEEKLFFIGRTKAARVARFKTQNDICELLSVEQGTYKQYETRTPLPYRYIKKFCIACGVEIDWLLTGEGKGPRREEYIKYVPKPKPKQAKSRRTRAA